MASSKWFLDYALTLQNYFRSSGNVCPLIEIAVPLFEENTGTILLAGGGFRTF